MRCQCLEQGCIHDVFLLVSRRKTVLVISNSCSAHFLKSSKSIAVALPYTFRSNHSFPGLVFCVHSGIEVPKEDEFVCPGCCRNHRIQIIIELVFNLIWVGHCWCIGTYKCCIKKGKRNVQGVPQSQTAALPRSQEVEETDKSKQAQIDQTYVKH